MWYRELETICKRYHVEMKAPEDIETFVQQASHLQKSQGAAAHLIFNEIESDIIQKHKFLDKQSSALEEMVAKYKMLLCKINVLSSLAKIFRMPNVAERLGADQE